MDNEEILKLAKEFPDIAQALHRDIIPESVIETFYAKAFNAGIEAVVLKLNQYSDFREVGVKELKDIVSALKVKA